MNREEILALRNDIETRTVKVKGRTYRLRGMTSHERDSFEVAISTADDPQNRGRGNIRASLLARTLVDENGKRIFTDDDAGELGKLPAAITDPLFDVAGKLSGLSRSDVEELAGNSESGPSAASSSD